MHTVHDSLFLESYIASKLANAEFRMEMESYLWEACPESPAGCENLYLVLMVWLCCIADGCKRELPNRDSRTIS